MVRQMGGSGNGYFWCVLKFKKAQLRLGWNDTLLPIFQVKLGVSSFSKYFKCHLFVEPHYISNKTTPSFGSFFHCDTYIVLRIFWAMFIHVLLIIQITMLLIFRVKLGVSISVGLTVTQMKDSRLWLASNGTVAVALSGETLWESKHMQAL